MGLVNSASRKRPREEPEVIEITNEDKKDLEDEVEEISPRRYTRGYTVINSGTPTFKSISPVGKRLKQLQRTFMKHSLNKGLIQMLLYTL